MYKDTEFLYASTRIRALEEKISTRELNEKMISAQSFEEAQTLYLDAVGARFRADGENIEYEKILDCETDELYSFAAEVSPDARLVEIFKYPYDCHNIKTAVKCNALGENTEGMLFSFGTVGIEELSECVRTGDYSPYPAVMAAAALDAAQALAHTDDPQAVDILLDRACLEACLEASRGTSEFLYRLMVTKVDLYNFSVMLRCQRMKRSFTYLRGLIMTCGSFDIDFFEKCYDISGIEKFQTRLQSTAYSSLAERLNAEVPISRIQKLLDEYYLEKTAAARFVSFGDEILCAYIVMRENEIKNSRIILSAKKAALSDSAIRERIRACE